VTLIDREKPLPLYERVKQHLRARIEAGEWRDGERLPSEHELMARFSASRMTVHRALREMSAAGMVHRVQGLGTFVAKETPRLALLEVTDIADDIASRGNKHEARVVTLEARRADPALAAAFGIRRGDKIFASDIVHEEDGVPVQLEQRFITPAFAPDYLIQDFTLITTNAYLTAIAPPKEVEHVIHAVMPDARVQALLDIPAHEACLLLERRTWTEAGPATKSHLIHPGSRYSLGSRHDLDARGFVVKPGR
jgi:GntR family histidine utilization transcriptional repressor